MKCQLETKIVSVQQHLNNSVELNTFWKFQVVNCWYLFHLPRLSTSHVYNSSTFNYDNHKTFREMPNTIWAFLFVHLYVFLLWTPLILIFHRLPVLLLTYHVKVPLWFHNSLSRNISFNFSINNISYFLRLSLLFIYSEEKTSIPSIPKPPNNTLLFYILVLYDVWIWYMMDYCWGIT